MQYRSVTYNSRYLNAEISKNLCITVSCYKYFTMLYGSISLATFTALFRFFNEIPNDAYSKKYVVLDFAAAPCRFYKFIENGLIS